MKTKFNFLILSLLLIIPNVYPNKSKNDNKKHFCSIDSIDIKIKYPQNTNYSKNAKRNLNSNDNNNEEFKPIQIYVDKTYLTYQKNNNPSLNNLYTIIINAFDKCVKTFNKLLKVKPLKNKINFIKNEDLNEWKFLSQYIDSKIKQGGEGISTDLLILPKFSINENINFEYIQAIPTYFDESNNRPIVGIVNINSNISLDLKNIDYLLQSILLHELTHILGFLVSLFKYYKGGEEKIIKYQKEPRTDVEKGFIISPTVISYAKKYFNCNSLKGVELERSTIDIIADSHWEARILLGEYMNSEIYTPEQVISEFTLALLEDSGWYKANYYTGGLMRFGKNQGCYFLEKDCYDYTNDEKRNEFFGLINAGDPSCSSGRQSRTYFILENSESFDLSQYNRKTKFVGRRNADYCYVSDLDVKEEEKMFYVGNCQRGGGYYGEGVNYNDFNQYSSSFFSEEFGEIYSKNSFCALSSVYPIGKTDEEKNENQEIFDEVIHSMCYPMFCTDSSLTIQIYNHFIVCPRGGGKVDVGGNYTGFLFCPDYNLICTGTKICNDMFDCVENESLLKESTYTYDYTDKTFQLISYLSSLDVVTDYEKENDGMCPKYCSKCKKNKKCYKCANDMVLMGKIKNDLEPITCNLTSEVSNKFYLDTEDNVYYRCKEGCESCQNADDCLKCLDGYKKINSKCEAIIENCDKYNNDYTQCVKCKNNTFIIGTDKSKCHDDIDIEKYYTDDGISYTPCNNTIEHCLKCSKKDYCLKCDENYFFIGDDRTKCYKNNDIDTNKYILDEDELVYFLCSDIIENCEECHNKNLCKKCKNGFVLIEDSNKKQSCKKDIDEDKYYTENEGEKIIYHLCNDSIPLCDECSSKDKCNKCQDGFSFIGNNYTKCHKEEEIEKDKYYSDDNGITYYSCDTQIQNCQKCLNKSYCIKCEDNYFFIGEDRKKCYKKNENEINMDEYYSEDNGTSYSRCDVVIENCNKCLNGSYCIKCNNEYYIIGDEKDKCHNKNEIDINKYFIDDTNETSLILCNLTLANCDECVNKTFCKKCQDGYIFIGDDHSKCVKKSEIEPNEYYSEDDGKTFYPCDNEIENCKKCLNKSYCIECEEGYFFINNDNKKCYKKEEGELDINEYYTEDNGTSFIKCDMVIENCKKCLNKSYCIQCKGKYYFISEEKDKCIEENEVNKQYYLDDNKTSFVLCNSTLLNCEECLNKTYCSKCKNNYFFINDDHSKCINNSEIEQDNTYYKDENSSTYYPCDNEIENCDKCLNKTFCIKCKENYFFIGEDRTTCHNEKDEQKYISVDNGTSFYACDTYIKNCEKCLNQSFCLECKSPFFLLGNNHIKCFDTKPENESKYYTDDEGITYFLCNATIEHCEECNGKNNCIKCEDNYFMVNNDKTKCVKKDKIDEDNYYFDEKENIYHSCNDTMSKCEQCSGKNNCTKCSDEYYFEGDDRTKCVKDLDIKKYYTEDNGTSYYPCDYWVEHCQECTAKNECTKCTNGYFLIGNNKSYCHNNIENIDNYYSNDDGNSYHLCNSSIDNCDKCENDLICKECKDSYILIINNNYTKCHKEEEIEKDKYYSDDNGITYYSCDTQIQNCQKCLNKSYCIKCEDNYFFIGEDRKKCYKKNENEINMDEYYSEDNGTSYSRCDVVIENCNKCLNGSYCIKCNNEYYIIGDEKDKCHNKNEIDDKKYYLDDNSTLILCNESIPFCEECESKQLCKKCMDNYFFIDNDRRTCHKEIDTEKYYSEDEGKSYYLCSKVIPHCEQCSSKDMCTKCENNFYLSNDFSSCFSLSESLNFCDLKIEEIPQSFIFDLSLIQKYVDSYILDMNNKESNFLVHHLINYHHNYSILIFKSSICTYPLIKYGYYYIDSQNLSQKLSKSSNIDINNFIFCFITYNEKSNLLLINQDDKTFLDIINECPQCSEEDLFNINNNFTSAVKNKLGNKVLNKIMLHDADIFDINNKIFSEICNNFTISGIDLPLKTRIDEIYLGKEREEIICTDYSCTFNSKSLSNFTGSCKCGVNSNSLDYLLNINESPNSNHELKYNSSKAKDALDIFSCINKGFNRYSFKNNPSFNIFLIMLLIQIIFLVFYIIFKGGGSELNLVSNPPKLILYTNMLNGDDDGQKEDNDDDANEMMQNNQSKDLNDSDYDEEIYIDEECIDKKKKNKNNEDINLIEDEKNYEKNKKTKKIKRIEIKLKSEQKEMKKFNNFFQKETVQDTNDKDQNSQSSLKTLAKLNSNQNRFNENVKNGDNNNKYQFKFNVNTNEDKYQSNKNDSEKNDIIDKNEKKNDNDNGDYNSSNNDENKKNIIIVKKKDEQNLITEGSSSNKVSISQMKTMENFIFKKKKRSIKNIVLSNKLILNKKGHSINNYNNNLNPDNNNILKQIAEASAEKKDLVKTAIDNTKKIRDIIIKKKLKKRDSGISCKNLIKDDSEEEKQIIKLKKPKSGKSNKTFKREMRKEVSKQSFKTYKNKKILSDLKSSSEMSNNNINKTIGEKTKKIMHMIMEKEKSKKKINISLFDYMALNEAKNKDFRKFRTLYWNILSLRHSVINLFSCIKLFQITSSYTPIQIKIIKFIFMIVLNMFINALILTQDYLNKKFHYFNNKYNILHEELDNITTGEKFGYAMSHSFPRVLSSLIICLIIQGLIEYGFFRERKKIYSLFILHGINEINKNVVDLMKKIKIKYYIFIFLNFALMVIFFIYLTNFSAVYTGGILDFIGAGILTFILLQIFPFVSSLILSLLRFYGLKNTNGTLYSLSQILSF